MITKFAPHAVAVVFLLTSQVLLASEYRHLEDHSHQLLGQIKDLKWLSEDLLVNHPQARSISRDLYDLRECARELDDAIYHQERLGVIVRQLNDVEDDLEQFRETLTRHCAVRGGHFHGPSVAVGGCQPGQDPVAFLLSKSYELDETLQCMERTLGIRGRHQHAGIPIIPQAPVNPVPYEVLPPRGHSPVVPPLPGPSQSYNNRGRTQPQPVYSNRQPGHSIDLGGVRVTFR